MGAQILPTAGLLAEQVRETGPEHVAQMHGVTVRGVEKRLNNAGYTRLGEEMGGERRAPSYPSYAAAPTVDAEDGWMADAACAGLDPSWWHPETRGVGGMEAAETLAKAICLECPVREACLTWALAWDKATTGGPWGVHGGLNGPERATLLRNKPGAA